ncbi:redoxin domain-containing protein (plasmid) [Paenibacillus rhizovicinus]|uniref:Redoxin domain-containing protein n=1 Tax=Paenibacillus rhizovicinus TaxID=2704463 RepID=A0A6C0PAK4_9BACL|nr:redoxin domain-containing protein [Paenibacillus rhizovicinus]QHW35411.1 redoxin domain-containing protein [Paenibacillus rhizovicinus]
MTERLRKRLSIVLIAGVIAVLAAVVVRQISTVHPAVAAVRKVAPAFDLKDMDGKEIRLSDYRGRRVVLHFWATYCPPCVKEMPVMQRIARQRDDTTVIGVNIGQSRGTVEAFAKSNGLTFPLVIDAVGKITDLYRIQALPTTILIGSDGRVSKIASGAFGSDSQLTDWLTQG